MANGIIIIDKPADWTSMDVCAKLRGILKTKKVGHAGTLDPMATGVLPVFVGQATRGVSFAESGEKEYVATLRLGLVTDTQDVSGRVLEEHPAAVTASEVAAALPRFTGDILQIPPMYSAIKVGGTKLYDIARRGGEVERKPRSIVISDIRVLGCDGGDWVLDVRCSKGTYIRTLCHDIGQALGCGGCMSALRRTEIGGIPVTHAHTLEAVIAAAAAGTAEELLIPVDSLWAALPEYRADEARTRRIKCGNEIKTPALPDGDYRVYSECGEFLMLGRAQGGVMKTVKSFFEV